MTAWATAFRAAMERERQAYEDRHAALRLRCPWSQPERRLAVHRRRHARA